MALSTETVGGGQFPPLPDAAVSPLKWLNFRISRVELGPSVGFRPIIPAFHPQDNTQPLDRTLVGLLKLHKLGSLLAFVDGVEERGNSIVLKCRNEILARLLQERFANHIRDVETRLGIKVVLTYPQGGKKVFRETFDNFFYGRENEFTVAALRSVALGGGLASSVFLTAEAGMGKTHLLKATANLAQFAGRKAVYLTAGKIMERLVGAYRSGGKPDFSNLKDAEVVLIDDVHTLKGKVFALEFLSRLMDRANSTGRTVVMASEIGPKGFRKPKSFRNRLMSNLVLKIHPYPAAVRRRILHARLSLHGVSLPPDYEGYVLERVHNPRALLGVAVRVRAHTDIYGTLPDFATFRNLISDLTDDDGEDVFSLFGVRDTRRKGANFYLAVYAMRLLGFKATEIAERVGCSRASVYNYIKRAKAILKNDPDKAEEFNGKLKVLRRDLL